MNEQTEKLIRELAEKLGTTTEHLWGAMLRQAPISGVVSILVFAAWAAGLSWAYRKLSTHIADYKQRAEQRGYPCNPFDEPFVVLPCVIWACATFIVIVAAGCELGTLAAALFNPEFWVLNHILEAAS